MNGAPAGPGHPPAGAPGPAGGSWPRATSPCPRRPRPGRRAAGGGGAARGLGLGLVPPRRLHRPGQPRRPDHAERGRGAGQRGRTGKPVPPGGFLPAAAACPPTSPRPCTRLRSAQQQAPRGGGGRPGRGQLPSRSSASWPAWPPSRRRPTRWARRSTARCACWRRPAGSRSSAAPGARGMRSASSPTRSRPASTCSASWPRKRCGPAPGRRAGPRSAAFAGEGLPRR